MSDSVSGKAFDLKLLRKILRYVAPYRGIFYGSFILTIVLSGLSTARPLLIQYVIDHFILEPDLASFTTYTG